MQTVNRKLMQEQRERDRKEGQEQLQALDAAAALEAATLDRQAAQLVGVLADQDKEDGLASDSDGEGDHPFSKYTTDDIDETDDKLRDYMQTAKMLTPFFDAMSRPAAQQHQQHQSVVLADQQTFTSRSTNTWCPRNPSILTAIDQLQKHQQEEFKQAQRDAKRQPVQSNAPLVTTELVPHEPSSNAAHTPPTFAGVVDEDGRVVVDIPHLANLSEERKIQLRVDPQRIRSCQQIADDMHLNNEQRKAFYIMAFYFYRELYLFLELDMPDQLKLPANHSAQLLMFVNGPGGTGKSYSVRALQQLAQQYGCDRWIRTGAYAAKAAQNISGQTLHSLFHIKTGARSCSKRISHKTIEQMRKQLKDAHAFVIDEISTVAGGFLAQISNQLNAMKGTTQANTLFGDFRMVLACGDFLQLQPVQGVSLFASRGEGIELWHQFSTVVRLTQQMRIVDQEWLDFTNRLRDGTCTEADVRYVNTCALSEIVKNYDPNSMNLAPLRQLLLQPGLVGAVFHDRFRTILNNHCAHQLALATGQPVLVVLAQDTTKNGQQFHRSQRRELLNLQDNDSKFMAGKMCLVPGMAVVMKRNEAQEFNLCNGSEGTLQSIILHPDEPPYDTSPQVRMCMCAL